MTRSRFEEAFNLKFQPSEDEEIETNSGGWLGTNDAKSLAKWGYVEGLRKAKEVADNFDPYEIYKAKTIADAIEAEIREVEK